MRSYEFSNQLKSSRSIEAKQIAWKHLQRYFGSFNIRAGTVSEDKRGADFVIDNKILIDQKHREKGCSEYWGDGEEIALEIWSVVPCDENDGVVGWTRDENKTTDFSFHTFDPTDSKRSFLFPLPALREVFEKNGCSWFIRYKIAVQSSGDWQSQCIFVPAKVLMKTVAGARSCLITN